MTRPLLLLLVVILLGAGVRLIGIATKARFTRDEAVSYLCAAGRQGEFLLVIKHKDYPYGAWSKAAQWKKFWKADKYFCFGLINSDLLQYDIHPPLYFWLLHIWTLIFGVHLWTGPSLNFLLDLFTAIAIYQLSRKVFDEPASAVMVVVLWFLSPSVIETSLIARQYSLLALFCVLFCIAVLRFTNQPRTVGVKTLLAVVFITVGGVLTHYYFVLLAVAATLWVVYVLRSHLKTVLLWLSGMAAALVVFLALNFNSYMTFRRYKHGLNPIEWEQLGHRLMRAVCSMFPYRCKDIISKYELPTILSVGIFLTIAVIAFIVLILLIRRKSRFNGFTGLARQNLFFFILMFIWFWGLIVGAYLMFKSPKHSMGGRYLTMAWPFFAITVVALLDTLGKYRKAAGYILCSAVILSGAGFIFAEHCYYRLRNLPEADKMVNSASSIVIDNTCMGVLPQIVCYLPNDTVVFAARQEDLIADKEKWLNRIDSDSLYLSQISSAATLQGRDKILHIAGEKFDIREVSYKQWGFDRRFMGLSDVYSFDSDSADVNSVDGRSRSKTVK